MMKRISTSMAAAAEYSFPILKGKQILICLQDLQIPVTEQILENPQNNRDEVLRVYEKLVEATTGATREEMSQPVFAGLSMLNYADLHDDSVPELAFFRAVSKMMAVSCVNDFCFNDMLTPNRQRLKRHLSAVINFCKFREERMMLYNELASEKEKLLSDMTTAQEDKKRLERELEGHKERTAEEAKQVEKVEADCRTVTAEINALNSQQAEIRMQIGDLKRQTNDLKDRLGELDIELQECHIEHDKLQGQIVTSPDRIRREMADQQKALEQERFESMQADKLAQRKEMISGGIAKAERDVQKALNILDEVEKELEKQKNIFREVRAAQNSVAENDGKSGKEEASIRNLESQIERYKEKIRNVREIKRTKGMTADTTLTKMQQELAHKQALREKDLLILERAENEVSLMEKVLKEEIENREVEKENMINSYKNLEKTVQADISALAALMKFKMSQSLNEHERIV